MNVLSIFVWMYDFVVFGEDGLMYQFIEQFVIFCVILNFMFVCFVDVNEIFVVWFEILCCYEGLVGIVLICQNILVFECGEGVVFGDIFVLVDNVVKGVYVFVEVLNGVFDVIIVVMGFEVQFVVNVCEVFVMEGVNVCVVFVLLLEWFVEQDDEYCESVFLVFVIVCVFVEVGLVFIWCGIVGDCGCLVGIDYFGVFVDYKILFQKFGIIIEVVIVVVCEIIKENV